MGRLAKLVVVAIVVSTGVAAAGGPAGSAVERAATPTTRPAAIRADLALLAHIPDAVRPTCLLIDTSYNYQAPGFHLVAELECHPDAATTIDYSQFPDASGAGARMDRIAGFEDPAPGCPPRQAYSVGGVQLGESVCGYYNEAASIIWTFDPLSVVGNLQRTDQDVGAARSTWNDDAGPDRAVHSVPPILKRAAAAKAGRKLLALIPDAAANKCKALDLSDPATVLDGNGPSGGPGIWLDAEVVCKGGFPALVTYRRYRDADAYAAAYDPTSYLQYAEPDDPACPNGYESGWSVNHEEVGRVACLREGAPPNAEAHLLWTYDPQQIVGDAFAAKQKSAQAIYDWWEQSAGPVE